MQVSTSTALLLIAGTLPCWQKIATCDQEPPLRRARWVHRVRSAAYDLASVRALESLRTSIAHLCTQRKSPGQSLDKAFESVRAEEIVVGTLVIDRITMASDISIRRACRCFVMTVGRVPPRTSLRARHEAGSLLSLRTCLVSHNSRKRLMTVANANVTLHTSVVKDLLGFARRHDLVVFVEAVTLPVSSPLSRKPFRSDETLVVIDLSSVAFCDFCYCEARRRGLNLRLAIGFDREWLNETC